ncbi:SLC13 family permease [Spirabiliibacterium falconis]|uniref:SLC13 family permease n=1 Tax=Spirabiliibacterium falconis TaxID=572023 RepID=UPI001AAD43D4|nr:SLC13 family permease [Spirabiliibacterium falconis]MBE2894001.1 SLC13/DASS family transporter [Spirabiliibacterium falconis]
MTTSSNYWQRLKSYRSGIIFLLDVILLFILCNTLPFSPTENRGLALLCFIGILWLTEAFNITVTSLMVPVVAILLGLINTKAALAPFATPIIFMFFGGFVLAAVLRLQELDKLIAHYIIRLAGGNLALTVVYLFTVTAFLSMWINNTAVAAMMLPLTLGLLRDIDYKQNRTLYIFILLGMAFSSSIGGIGTLIGSAPNAILASQLDISFAEWLKYGFPVMMLLMPSMIIALWLILRPNFNIQFTFNMEKVTLDRQKWLTLIIFGLTALILVFSSLINPMLTTLLNLSEKIQSFDSIIALTAVVALTASGVARWSEVQKHVEWGVLLLFGGGLTLSVVLKSSGASHILADSIVQFIGNKHWLIITLVLTCFIIFLTEFTSNTASAALLMPIFISVADSLNAPPIALAAIIACGASCAFMLPIATPPNAIVYSTGYIKQSDMAKVGIVLNIFCVLVIGLLAYYFWL